MIEIRAATPADARALAELRWEFRAGKTPPTEAHEAFVARCAAWMSAELERGAWRTDDATCRKRAGVADFDSTYSAKALSQPFRNGC